MSAGEEAARTESAGRWVRRNPALLCLGVAVAASLGLRVALGEHAYLFGDDLRVIVYRRGIGADVLLDPLNSHLVVAVVGVFKVLLALFGLSSPIPFHLASGLLFMLAAVMLFVWARSRVGDWLALLGTTLILFLGAAVPTFLGPIMMIFAGSIAAGLGALMALERDDRTGDLVACALLVVSLSFSETGFAFAVGALVRIALSSGPRLRRAFVVAVPAALYGIWWLGWGGGQGRSDVSLDNLLDAPRYVLDAAATTAGSLTGLSSPVDVPPHPVGEHWAPIALAVIIGLITVRLVRSGRVPPGVWVTAAIAITFWGLSALSFVPGREPGNGRIVYPGAIFLLMVVAECWAGERLGTRGLLAAAAAVAVAVAANLSFLWDGYTFFFRPAGEQQRATLTALEIGGPDAPHGNVDGRPLDFFLFARGAYLAAARDFGIPAYSESELATANLDARVQADRVLAGSLTVTAARAVGRPRGCRALELAPNQAAEVELGPGPTTLVAGADATARISVGRFAAGTPVEVGRLAPASDVRVMVPRDGSPAPWRLGVEGRGAVRVCSAGSEALR